MNKVWQGQADGGPNPHWVKFIIPVSYKAKNYYFSLDYLYAGPTTEPHQLPPDCLESVTVKIP